MSSQRIQVYVVEPTGYAEMVHSDKDAWCLYVVDGGTKHGWSIRRGSASSSYVMTRTGEWVFDDKKYLRHRRFPVDKALELAHQFVDTHTLNGCTAQQASDRVAARIAERDSVDTETPQEATS